MRALIVIPILSILALLVVAPSTWALDPVLEAKIDTLTPTLIGTSIPSNFATIMSNGTVVLKITEQKTVQDAHVNFLDPGTAYKDQWRYTIDVKDSKITNIKKGANIGYTLMVVVTEDALNRIYAAKDHAAQAKQEVADNNLRYRAYGYVDLQLQFIKIVGPFLALFSADIANVIPFLGGLITLPQ
jgi:hypothetical protein